MSVTPMPKEGDRRATALGDIEIFTEGRWHNTESAVGRAVAHHAAKPTSAALPWLDLTEWANIDPPPRDWLVPDLIPMGCVTSLYGDGGSGKTMLALWLMLAMASGPSNPRTWLDERVLGLRSVGMFAEDDAAELVRRLQRISLAMDVPFASVAPMITALPGVGLDTVIAGFADTGDLVITPVMEAIIEKVRNEHASLLVLDYAAALFGGNEIDRFQVSTFMRRLNAIAAENDIAILLLGHPSMDGMKGGRGTSGSTAWRNQSRSFLHLTVDDVQDDPDERVLLTLRHTKSNYGRSGRTFRMASDGSRFEILERQEREAKRATRAPMTAAQKVALHALQQAVDQGGQPSPGGSVPAGVRCVTIDLWRHHAYAMSTADTGEAKRKAFLRAREQLQGKQLVGVCEPYAWVSEAAA